MSSITATAAADIYRQAACLNREDPLLQGSILEFPDYGQLVMTGDLHGHSRNFGKLQRYCDLGHAPARHVMLHELIHEELAAPLEPDLSHELLLEAARWKCEFPDQVHFLQSNHELSQLAGHEISKGGRIVTQDFERGLELSYGPAAGEVLEALLDFLTTHPLAGRTQNRVFLAHSVPGPRTMPDFEAADLWRPTTHQELLGRGTPYALVWGRYQTEAGLEQLARDLDVDAFICGHQPQDDGFALLHGRLLILASDHNHGVYLPFDLRRKVTVEDLERMIRPFAAIE
ncbi:MAG: hypothetical protein IID40_06280 [Planctomycetes bacterium]|nr:hypothetical protein [Planctomycetota bacterium]